jgi:hypothetical protein
MNYAGKPLAGAILVVALAAVAASCSGSSGSSTSTALVLLAAVTIDAVVRRGRIASV